VHVKVTEQRLDPQALVEHVRTDEAGAVVLFFGVVRNPFRACSLDRHPRSTDQRIRHGVGSWGTGPSR